MDSFFEKLANSALESNSSEHLKLLGKRAAGLYLRKEADSLTDAVRGVVSEEDLTQDQVRRVTEMANQATWQEAFHEQGQRDTSFPPADADAVLGELAERPAVVSSDLPLDYYDDVPNQTKDVDWANVFGVKADTEEYEYLNPAQQEEATAVKTASAEALARFGADQILSDLVTTGEDFYGMVKHAHLTEGFGILQISQAVGQAVQDPDFGVALMRQTATRMEREGIRFNDKVEMEKVSHALVINTSHPLMLKTAVLEKLAKCYYTAGEAHKDLQSKHRGAVKMLRDKTRGA
jgi:hypothetical protein